MSTAEYHWEMVIATYSDRTYVTVRGPETKASLAGSPTDAEFFGIVFKVGTFMPHLPVNNLVNENINLTVAGDSSFWLDGCTWELPTFENADTFIEHLVHDEILVHDPLVEAVRRGHQHNVSLRTVQRRFVQATGLSQKAIWQIERAQQAKTLLELGMPINDVVYEAGYYDQPHLTKALKQLVGQTPAEILQLSAIV